MLLALLILTAMRLAFWGAFGGDSETTIDPFLLGLRFDLRLSLLLTLPSLVLWMIPPFSPFKNPTTRCFHAMHLAILVSLVVLFHVADFAHYSYLRERSNASSLRFLEDAGISLRFVWDTYPVLITVGLVALLGVGLYVLLRWVIERIAGREAPSRVAHRATTIVFIGLFVFGLYGKVSFYPLRWSDAFSSPRRFDADVALNPLLFFCDTLCASEPAPPDAEAIAPYYDRVADFLRLPPETRRTRTFARPVQAKSTAGARPNVVVILMESLAAHQTGMFGNPLDPSPPLDALAKESRLFTRCYTPAGGTARAVFALLTGIPDTSMNRAATRNPSAVDQYTLLDAFEGYEKFYFLGGSASWANVRGLFAHNVTGVRIFEEGSYVSPRGDVWGISDLHLFDEANRILSVQQRPFVAIIHLSGNHRPFTIPEDTRGFRTSDLDAEKVAPYGFDSKAEFESFRFMDHSLGLFLETARAEPYFRNTLLFIVGDNGDAGRAPHMPKAEAELGLTLHHTPLIIHGPGIRTGRVDSVVSQIDVFPTVAAAIGAAVTNKTLGRDVLRQGFEGGAFLHRKRGAVADLWLIGDRFCLAMNATGADLRLYAYDAPRKNVATRFPDVTEDMRKLCRGLYLTSRYLPYHNHRRP